MKNKNVEGNNGVGAENKKVSKCVFKDCKDGVARSRGLCERHYSVIAGLVKSGKVQWSELEKRGLATQARSRIVDGIREDVNRVLGL